MRKKSLILAMLMLALIISLSAIVYADNEEITVTVEEAGFNIRSYDVVYRYNSEDKQWEYLAGIILKSWINVKRMYVGYADELVYISGVLEQLGQTEGLQFLNEVNAGEHTSLKGSPKIIARFQYSAEEVFLLFLA